VTVTAWLNMAAMPPGVMVETTPATEPLPPVLAPIIDATAWNPEIGVTTTNVTDETW
jgi:hypothetical protein